MIPAFASMQTRKVFAMVAMVGLVLLLAGCAGLPQQPGAGCNDCPELIAIPAGHFTMGTPASDTESWGAEREGPQHEVTIARAFALGRYEVTRGEFARFVAETGEVGHGCFDWSGSAWVDKPALDWRNPGFAQTQRDPVVCVTAADAERYAQWLSAKTGARYRLPSEAEWEYAARAGTATRRHWGDSAAAGCTFANFPECNQDRMKTLPVGSLAPNPWGLHDMLGNVWEWTADCWHEGYAGAPVDGSARTDPSEGGASCVRRVNRGAGWNSNSRNVRSSNRGNYAGVYRYNIIGFRLARD